MSRPRLLVSGPWARGQVLAIKGRDARRLTRVLRLGKGDVLSIFDGQGVEGGARILELRGWAEVKLEVLWVERAQAESPLKIHLVQGLPKWPKMEVVAQKVTELGVEEVCGLLARRSVPWSGEGERWKRLERIMEEASRQCGRANVPKLSGPWKLEEFLRYQRGEPGARLLLWEGERTNSLKAALEAWKIPPEQVWLAVGPEGGFDEEEVKIMNQEGYTPVSMGPRILRTETASMAVVAIAQYLWGDMGGRASGMP